MPNKKVWLDLLTPKQVLFFNPVVKDLESAGCDVLSTSRSYREVDPLAKRARLNLRYVGERGGRGLVDQLEAATRRQAEIIPIVKEFGPRVAVSIASGVCARVAFGLGAKHIAVNDSPHSEVAGRLSIPLSYHLMCPWVIPYGAWTKFGITRKQITTYHALDPVAWLRRKAIGGPVPKLGAGRKTITVRVQEIDAPYLADADRGWTDVVLRAMSEAYPDYNLVALCRYDYQVEEVKRKFGARVIVPDDIVDGQGLLAKTDLFIGMGGTMNAEAVLMGVPTISAFQGTLYTDEYLQRKGLLAKALRPKELLKQAERFLSGKFRATYAQKAKRVLDSMEDPVPKITRFILRTLEQG